MFILGWLRLGWYTLTIVDVYDVSHYSFGVVYALQAVSFLTLPTLNTNSPTINLKKIKVNLKTEINNINQSLRNQNSIIYAL